MKKLLVAAIVLWTIAGVAVAEESELPKHMVSVGVSGMGSFPCIVGADFFASYEFAIIPQFSVGASAAFQMYPMAIWGIVFDTLENGESAVKSYVGTLVEAQAHWYPWAGSFHVDAGLGWSYYLSSMHTLLIAPGVGWRIDFGEPGGFFINIGLRAEIFAPLGDSVLKLKDKDSGEVTELIPVNPLSFRLGFGFRF